MSSRALVSLVVALVALPLVGCGDDEPVDSSGTIVRESLDPAPDASADGSDSTDPDSTDPDSTDVDSTDGSTPLTTQSSAPVSDGEVTLTELAQVGSLSALDPHPETGDLFLAARDGTVLVFAPGTDAEPVEIADFGDRTVAEGERGLLGLAVAPDGDFLYLYYTDTEGHSRLDEYPLDGRTVDVSSRREVLFVEQPFSNHNGGELSFGPDGFLYLGLGDGGAGGDPEDNGQDLDALLGKILRIDPRAATGGAEYGIPEGNPFADGTGAPEIWLYGARNPWRFSWDSETGDLWVADVGQNLFEEIDFLPADDTGAGAGANLGWNEMEGFESFQGGTEPADHVPPVFQYSRDDGCSVTGGYVYRGEALPFLDGVYVFGDFCTSELWGLTVRDGVASERLDLGLSVGGNQLVSFGQDLDGEIYVLTNNGTLYRLDPAS